MVARWLGRLRSLPFRLILLPIPAGLLAIAAFCWWLTEPIVDETTVAALSREVVVQPKAAADLPASPGDLSSVWPTTPLEGRDAKVLNLKALELADARLAKVQDYTATFYRLERIGGKLGSKQKIEIKVRHQPFSVYFRFIEPQNGKEVVYAEGRHENKLIAHGGGLSRLLVPRLAVPPNHPLALADSRHAITEAGIANLTRRLLGFRKLDLTDPDAVTVLDRTVDDQNRPRLRSVHTHLHPKPERPFARIEVLYDPDTLFPCQIKSYDWPKAGEPLDSTLAESYTYDDLKFDVALTALDFDPANPAYMFHRY